MSKWFVSVTLICSFLLINSFSFSQTDTTEQHRTIKIAKQKDSTYVKAFTDFFVYYGKPSNDLSFKDYVLRQQQNYKSMNTERLKIIDAKPKSKSDENFDYTLYFQKNHFTKDIKMRPGEADTVRLLVYVDNTGIVKFLDLSTIARTQETVLIEKKNNTEFKYDVTHIKTQNAFKELTVDNWQPAVIKALKTHPSKRKNKYEIANGFSEGVLTIIYSSQLMAN